MDKLAEVLAELRNERRELLGKVAGLDRAIAAIEQTMGGAPPPPAMVQNSAPTALQRIAPEFQAEPPGPYAMRGIYEAAAAYLSTIPGEPRSARQIAEALLAGGFQTKATNFPATVRTMMHRHLSATSYGIYATPAGDRWFFRA
jgi:hypothetical protein